MPSLTSTGADLGFQKGGFVLVPENVTGGATCISSCFHHQGFSLVPENVTGGATCQFWFSPQGFLLQHWINKMIN